MAIKRIWGTVKARIILMILCFSLAITTLIISLSYYLIYTYQLNTSIQSIKFNLQLTSQTIERDLIEVIALANWCGNGANPISRFFAADYDILEAVRVYERLQQEQLRNNRANEYINRVLVLSNEGPHIIHAGMRSNNSTLSFIDKEKDTALDAYELSASARIFNIGLDPYDRSTKNVLNILGPVYAPSRDRVIGTVYMAVSTNVLIQSLKGYNLPQGAKLYITIYDNVYLIDGDSFIPTTELGEIIPNEYDDETGQHISVGRVIMEQGNTLDAVSCRVRDGIMLTQVLDLKKSLPPATSWLSLLPGICLLILALSIAVIFLMNRTISRPVALIRRKIDNIAAGDFSPDPSIESDSEIGNVGKGINKLSLDIVALMESRIADEKQKRELEYRMLQSQVNPHFLYNSLGTIKWMATLQKANGIVEVSTALSRLLRTVSKDLRKEVPLRDEVLLLDDYFLILKYRYGAAVEFIKRIENETLLDCMIPRFVLQPLMENAIFHGIEPKGKGRIELRIERDNEAVCVSIWDDGVGITPDALALLDVNDEKTQTDELAHIGMRSVHQRIQNAFGDAYGLTAQSEQNAYTQMTIRIPFNTPDKKPPLFCKTGERPC